MNEEYNPYNIPAEPVSQPVQPQQPFQQPQPPVQQTPAPQQQFGNHYPQGYTYPPQYSNGNRPYYTPNTAPQKESGAARVFGIVSFIIGCFAILITSMIYFNFRSSVSDKFGYATMWSCIVGLPSLIFGVISLMKKTDKKLFPILGIAFAAVLMLCAFITYFVMVNTAATGGRYY